MYKLRFLFGLLLSQCLAATALRGDDLWPAQAVPLLEKYCFDCHSNDTQEAEVNLEGFAAAESLIAAESMWKETIKQVEFGSMPPGDMDQPTDEERKTLLALIEGALYGDDCDLDAKPGKVTVRRLNRNEYNNTIRDLFGVTIRPADAFPSDEVGAGFDNNGDVLTLPPMLLEKYVEAAETVAAVAVTDPKTLTKIDARWQSDKVQIKGNYTTNNFEIHTIDGDGEIYGEFESPYDGDYGLIVEAAAVEKDSTVTLEAFLDGETSLGKTTFKFRDSTGGVHRQTLKVKLTKGKHTIDIRAVKSDEKKDDEKKDGEKKDGEKKDGEKKDDEKKDGEKKDGEKKDDEKKDDEKKDDEKKDDDTLPKFRMRGMYFEGPYGIPKERLSGTHWQLLRHRPQRNKRSTLDAAKENLKDYLPLAFRSPVDDETVARYAALVDVAVQREEAFERGMQVAITASLLSPRFLFRSELPSEGAKPGELVALDPYQLASRLSYMFWASMPDNRLRDLAKQGKLTDEAVLRSEVKRMLAEPKGEALVENFADQWLGLRNLSGLAPDPKQFPKFDEKLREAMIQETRLTFTDCMRGDGSVLSLLDSQDTFLNERLADHYGIEGVEGDEFRRVSLKGTGRKGILTQASILMLTSNPTRTSPVKRGKWVMENILGTPPPDPPAGVPELEATNESNPDAPLREQLAIHRDNAMCASCHRVMDQIGFSFEHFDVTGQWRDRDGKHPIDASGTLPSGESFADAQQMIAMLRETRGTMFVTELTRRLMTYALGRELTRQDECVVEDIVAATEADGWKFRDIATAIVLSKPFRYQTAPVLEDENDDT
ncbi:DUF1592 domain-containing protein [Rosistilla oblonga]|uniref:Planctomycete cytochrome C n=1 Tax=Rosistilla oblonga TaxID=2527990 RepID=A0A518IWH2_9BACT|nr:DUF1592 domain-containing protein [Rosistilla oblonga]QDV57427.1 hypothetical protein Mal33_34370 [Rosistilla oblonga]